MREQQALTVRHHTSQAGDPHLHMHLHLQINARRDAAAAGLVSRRWTPARFPALGWLTGFGCFAVLPAALELSG